MVMLLLKGIPTLQTMVTKNWTRVDNVFAMHNTEHLVVACNTDPRQRGPGTDHVPVLTTLDLEIPAAAAISRRNFRAVDWSKFRQMLTDQLDKIPGPRTLLNESQFQEVVDDLMTALQAAIEHAVPLSKPSPHLRRWWNDELSRLKKEMNRFASASYRYRAVADHPSHSQYMDSRNKYGLKIKRAKKRHWDAFLEELSGNDLWTAQRYATSPAGDGGKARIPTLMVPDGVNRTKSITTNEEKSFAFSEIFFPKRPAGDLVPPDPQYPSRVGYSFKPSMAQLHRCVA